MGKSRVSWNPMHWDPWERATGAIIVTFLLLGAVVVLYYYTGRLDAVDAWLSTREGQTVSRAFGIVALIFAIITSVVGAFLIWVRPFLIIRAEKRAEAVREEVRRALGGER